MIFIATIHKREKILLIIRKVLGEQKRVLNEKPILFVYVKKFTLKTHMLIQKS